MYITRLIDRGNSREDYRFDRPETAEALLKDLAVTRPCQFRSIYVLDTDNNTILACAYPDVLGRFFFYRLGCRVRIRPGYRSPGEPDYAYTLTGISEDNLRCCISHPAQGQPADAEEFVNMKMLFPA